MKKALSWIWFIFWILCTILLVIDTVHLFQYEFRLFDKGVFIFLYIFYLIVFLLGFRTFLKYQDKKQEERERLEYERAKEYIAKVEAEKRKENL
jgi:hypothetical protein